MSGDGFREWGDRGFKWMGVTLGFCCWTFLGSVAVRIAWTAPWKIAMLILFSGIGLLGAVASLIRMLYCYRKANKS
jgi:hypothetical protein